MQSHQEKVLEISNQIKLARKLKIKPRVYRGSTNVTRQLNFKAGEVIDIRNLNEILEINIKENWVDVEPNVSMQQLVDAVLPLGFIPPVVMEFPNISAGGGWQGGAGESSSFKYGLFHQCSNEVEVVDGLGNILSLKNKQEMYEAFSCSYGSLGILTKIRLKLIKASPHVEISYLPFNSFSQAVKSIELAAKDKSIDFLDSIIFSENSGVVMVGKFSKDTRKAVPISFTKTYDTWFYQHVENKVNTNNFKNDYLNIKDYLFRYNRGAFWVGKYFFDFFKLPFNKLTQNIFSNWLNAKDLYNSLHAANFSQHFFIQDFCLPIERAEDFLQYLNSKLKIYPLWICPIMASQENDKLSPANCRTELVLNVGIYGIIKKGEDYLKLNRDVEVSAVNFGARKVLYAHNYYPKDEFWKIFDYNWYKDIRSKFYAEDVFPDVFEKTYVSKVYKGSLLRGALNLILKIKWKTVVL